MIGAADCIIAPAAFDLLTLIFCPLSKKVSNGLNQSESIHDNTLLNLCQSKSIFHELLAAKQL